LLVHSVGWKCVFKKKEDGVLDKNRTIDNVLKHICTNRVSFLPEDRDRVQSLKHNFNKKG
jgi:hypothetical protein